MSKESVEETKPLSAEEREARLRKPGKVKVIETWAGSRGRMPAESPSTK